MIKLRLKKYLRSINYDLVSRCFKIFFIGLIIFSIITSSFITGYHSYLSFYDKGDDPAFDKFRAFLNDRKGYQCFLNYTGLDTGYGFFSPNVSSDFVITHELFINGKKNVVFSNSMFKTKEGAMRFTNINSLYMDRIDEIENDSIKLDTMRSKYLDLILNRMNSVRLSNNPELDSIQTTLYLYHFPFLKEYPNVKPKFITIERHKKTREVKQLVGK